MLQRNRVSEGDDTRRDTYVIDPAAGSVIRSKLSANAVRAYN
jgi:hypothetical protein